MIRLWDTGDWSKVTKLASGHSSVLPGKEDPSMKVALQIEACSSRAACLNVGSLAHQPCMVLHWRRCALYGPMFRRHCICPLLGESSAQYQSKGSEKSCRADTCLCATWQFPNPLTAGDYLSYKANRQLRGQLCCRNVLKKNTVWGLWSEPYRLSTLIKSRTFGRNTA